MANVLESLDAARQAAARYGWREAYDSYSNVDVDRLDPDDLEQFANAAWWTGRLDHAIGLRQQAHAGLLAGGDETGAARLALTLYWDEQGRGAFAVARGWLATAERVLERQPESVVHARLAISHAVNALFAEGDVAKALEKFDRAYELGERFGDRDTQAVAMVGKGRTLAMSGDVEGGLALLDEATAAAVSGGLHPFSTGLVYCITIGACRDLGDYRRAAEWTEAANRWCDRLDVSGFPGACRIHRAEVLRLRGDWPKAEQQALAACEELHDFDRRITAGGYYEIAEIRRRRGDFALADEAYAKASELGQDPQPGLALLRLAEGRVDAAVAAISRALGDVREPLARLRSLPAHVEISLAAADPPTARAAAEELESIVDSYRIGAKRAPAFDATVHYAAGQIALAEGDAGAAAQQLREARDRWLDIGAPYETAQVRTLLGIAYRRQGDEHAATVELRAAQTTFAQLGARLDEARVQELLGRVETRRTFLFTDIVESTKLLETLGDERWKKLLTRHDELVRERILESRGELIKQTGDGFFASFESAKPALEAAISIQRALRDELVAPDVRIGVHAGGAFKTGVSYMDYGGEGVHVAARIGAAAGRGEILVSRQTLDGIAGQYRLSEPRATELKGFEKPVEVVSVEWR